MAVLIHVLLQAMAVMTNLTRDYQHFQPILGSLPQNSIPVEMEKPVVIKPDKVVVDRVTLDPVVSVSVPEQHAVSVSEPEQHAVSVSVLRLPEGLEQYQSYSDKGQETIADIKELMLKDGWKSSRKDKTGTLVKYLFHPKYNRRIFLTTAVLPAPPDVLYRVMWTEGGRMHDWNPKIEEVEILKEIGDHTQISRQVAANEAGGIVTQRDFVNVNQLEVADSPLGKIYYLGYVSTEWPDKPPMEDFVRAENGPSGFKFEPVEGDPSSTKLTWVFNADLKFDSLPPTMINAVLPASTLNYVSSLRKHLEDMKRKGQF